MNPQTNAAKDVNRPSTDSSDSPEIASNEKKRFDHWALFIQVGL
jgi:hypothetical protein